MRTSQRILTTSLWMIAVMGMLAIVGSGLWGAHRANEPSFDVKTAEDLDQQPLFELPAFNLLNEHGDAITDASLRGHVWIGSFIFTRCAGPCPIILSKLAGLQKTLEDPNIKLISFTVDPAYDTPEVLRKRGDEMHVDYAKWSFVTGQKEVVEQTLRKMLQPKPEQEGGGPLMHDTHLYLFDNAGKCRHRYSINDDDEMNKLITDAKALAAQAEQESQQGSKS